MGWKLAQPLMKKRLSGNFGHIRRVWASNFTLKCLPQIIKYVRSPEDVYNCTTPIRQELKTIQMPSTVKWQINCDASIH